MNMMELKTNKDGIVVHEGLEVRDYKIIKLEMAIVEYSDESHKATQKEFLEVIKKTAPKESNSFILSS